jgi:hypothetical protein
MNFHGLDCGRFPENFRRLFEGCQHCIEGANSEALKTLIASLDFAAEKHRNDGKKLEKYCASVMNT